MFNLQFIKSIIEVHNHYKSNNFSNDSFLIMINKCFNIKKTTFYDWMNNDDIINAEIIYENNNKLINTAVEKFIIDLFNNNSKIKIKNIKNKIKDNFKITINNKSIYYILLKNNLKHKNIKSFDIYKDNKINKKKIEIISLTTEQKQFIINNKNENIKQILILFFNEYKINIHQKQIVDVMYQNKFTIKSFFKLTPTLNNYILKCVEDNKIITVKQVQKSVLKELNVRISTQFIYDLLKKNNYVYKKFKYNNNPYKIEEQVDQFKNVNKTHNEKNINNCISIDEISFLLGSKPNNGWFKKGDLNEIKCNSKKIIRERYSLLVASSNEKILLYKICKKGVKSEFFTDFMKELKKLDIDNKKYYLLDNARIHRSKMFNLYLTENEMNIVYNAPYHSETNPIENIFSMFRNYLNRNVTETELELKNSIEEFIKIDNKEKFKNIFNHSCKMINEFLKINEKK